MDLETKFKKETGFNAYENNNSRPKVPSDYYVEWLEEQLTLTDVVSSFITADDEGKYFILNIEDFDELEKGSVVCLLRTYPEDIHLFTDKNGDEVWIHAEDVDRKG
tara:strand:+ start:151 stop:468 length:318 start_codon:yes stop_codon:yes gene_type:complete